jgi:hypothetical protein
MSTFRFKFNKKTIHLNIDETIQYLHYNVGWFSITLYAYDLIENSNVFTDEDKKQISRLRVYQIYKMLKKI